MTDYIGDRTIDGIVVTVDGKPLNPRTDIKTYTDLGFEWTYEGESPRQLALAILMDHFSRHNREDAQTRALAMVEPFMSGIVAHFANSWTMSSDDIERAVATLED